MNSCLVFSLVRDADGFRFAGYHWLAFVMLMLSVERTVPSLFIGEYQFPHFRHFFWQGRSGRLSYWGENRLRRNFRFERKRGRLFP